MAGLFKMYQDKLAGDTEALSYEPEETEDNRKRLAAQLLDHAMARKQASEDFQAAVYDKNEESGGGY